MEANWKEFLLCAPIYAPGLVLIVVGLVALGIDRASHKKAQAPKAPPGDGQAADDGGPPGPAA